MEKIYDNMIAYILTVLESDEITNSECKKMYSSIIKGQMDASFSITEKIASIFKTCNEYVLQKLWFNVLKKKCYLSDIINILKNELIERDLHSLWCQDVFNATDSSEEVICSAAPSTAFGKNYNQ